MQNYYFFVKFFTHLYTLLIGVEAALIEKEQFFQCYKQRDL